MALIDKSLPRESQSEFMPRTHPIHSNMSKNHVLVLIALFQSGQKTSHPRVPIMALIDKSSPQDSRSKFLPRTHPVHSNISKNHVLVLFELFHSGQKHRTQVSQYMPILELIDKSTPRESRSEFLPRTHPIHSNMCKNHVLVLFELFHSGQKHRTRVGQYWH